MAWKATVSRTQRMRVTRNGKVVEVREVQGVSRHDAYVGACLKHPEAQKIDTRGQLILRFAHINEEWEF